METIPGSAQELLPGESVAHSSCDATLSNHETAAANAKFWRTKRWEKFGRKQPPMTPRRVNAIRDKRDWERFMASHGVNVKDPAVRRDPSKLDAVMKLYASGQELGNAFRNGALKPQTVNAVTVVNAFGSVRDKQLALISVIAAPVFAWGRKGVLASYDELGIFVGLRWRRMVDLVHELVEDGLLTQGPMFRPFEAVCNQRSSRLELTPRLHEVLARQDRARALRCNSGPRSSRSGLQPNPEPLVLISGEETETLRGVWDAIVPGSPDQPATRLPDASASASCPATYAQTRTAAVTATTGGIATADARDAIAAAAISPELRRELLALLPSDGKNGGAS